MCLCYDYMYVEEKGCNLKCIQCSHDIPITVIMTLRSVDQVSALLVQSNSHDIGNEKGSKKFNFQVL